MEKDKEKDNYFKRLIGSHMIPIYIRYDNSENKLQKSKYLLPAQYTLNMLYNIIRKRGLLHSFPSGTDFYLRNADGRFVESHSGLYKMEVGSLYRFYPEYTILKDGVKVLLLELRTEIL